MCLVAIDTRARHAILPFKTSESWPSVFVQLRDFKLIHVTRRVTRPLQTDVYMTSAAWPEVMPGQQTPAQKESSTKLFEGERHQVFSAVRGIDGAWEQFTQSEEVASFTVTLPDSILQWRAGQLRRLWEMHRQQLYRSRPKLPRVPDGFGLHQPRALPASSGALLQLPIYPM